MSSDERRSGIHRRDFLFRTTSGIALGVTAAVSAPGIAAAAEPAPEAGYRETEHVRKAYALARF
ncbi:MAG TPA: formate dehydrogenase [Azospirillum sp.]|nr:formate dehydrogenase [Azospirillum sp.]